MKSTIGFVERWGDTASRERMEKSEKSKQVLEADFDNHLKDCAMLFQGTLNTATRNYWAKELVNLGFTLSALKEACKIIPRRFSKMPSFSELLELMNTFRPRDQGDEDELDKYTKLATPILKTKLITAIGDEKFERLVDHFITSSRLKTGFGIAFSRSHYEIAVLGCWLRSGFKGYQAIIDEDANTTVKHLTLNHSDLKDYLLIPLKRFVNANNGVSNEQF